MQNDLKLYFVKATSNDVDSIFNLESTQVENKMYSCASSKEEISEDIKKDEMYIIYMNEEVVGYTSFEIKSPEHAYLSGLLVSPKYQAMGIGKAAAEFRLGKLKEYKRVDLVTHPNNVKIINMYSSLGFKIENTVEDYFGDGEPRLILSRIN